LQKEHTESPKRRTLQKKKDCNAQNQDRNKRNTTAHVPMSPWEFRPKDSLARGGKQKEKNGVPRGCTQKAFAKANGSGAEISEKSSRRGRWWTLAKKLRCTGREPEKIKGEKRTCNTFPR